jgi:hypothetical protein
MSRARLAVAVAVVALGGCARPAADQAPPAAAGASIDAKTEQGPLVATVSVAPAKPKVGDVVRLTLAVEVDAGVEVTMPPFGEALGRFEVVGFVPREEAMAGGKRRLVQDYRLQASRSGRLRVPPLRIEYVDHRGAAGGKAAAPPTAEELLTEEIPLDIQSVLTAEGAGTLPPLRGALAEAVDPRWVVGALAGGVLVLGLGLVVVVRTRRRRSVAVRRSAADVALGRLAALAARGTPTTRDDADPWYVELSDVVRRYLEDRFGVRAPELTTEEFLRESRFLAELGGEQQALLGLFLVGCDRVKFAGHAPDAAESQGALDAARRLIADTRLTAAEARDA